MNNVRLLLSLDPRPRTYCPIKINIDKVQNRFCYFLSIELENSLVLAWIWGNYVQQLYSFVFFIKNIWNLLSTANLRAAGSNILDG